MTSATWYCISSLLVVYIYSSSVLASCPTMFYYSNHTCECGKLSLVMSWVIHCNKQEMKAEIADDYCATYVKQEGQYYAGKCPFRLTENKTREATFSELPSDPDLLNHMMCGPHNRTDFLCGRCIDGYGPAVYSVEMKCINSSRISTGSAICLYLLLELVPITLFFMCVLFFHLNITTGPLLGYVLFCQVYYTYALGKDFLIFKYFQHSPLWLLSMTLSGSWSLQFFKLIIPPFCISSKLTGIHIQMLNLVATIYPVILVIITCTFMELHASYYRVLYILWKPFSILFNRIQITAVTSNAVLHAFATFIFLSTSTLSYSMQANFNLDITPIYRVTDATKYKHVLYYDPTVTAFSHKHILYIVMVGLPFILLVLIPSVLLCVYPTRICSFLSRFVSARKRLAITAFVEALNNCFKDGLNGTRDYRPLAGCIISVAIVGGIINYIILKAGANEIYHAVTLSMIWIFLSVIISYVRPCKLTIANLSLSYHFMVIGILYFALYCWTHDRSIPTETLEKCFIIFPLISHILVFMWAGYKLTQRLISHFGYGFNPHDCKAALTNLANDVKRQFSRRHGNYQVLPDTATQ